MNVRTCLIALVALLTPVFAKASLPEGGGSVPARFTVAEKAQVPGRTLVPGDYTVRVLDRLHDRMVVQVEHNGKLQSTFLALPSSSLHADPGPIFFGGPGKGALRGFSFADGTVAEFVYPKAEAVVLAKANGTTVPAIDPASEGKSDTPTLSAADRQLVTLWMLSPALVGPEDSGPGVTAVKYKQPVVSSASTEPTVQAQAHVPPRPRPRPLMAVLPHTAGSAPLFGLAGVLACFGAGLLMLRRLRLG